MSDKNNMHNLIISKIKWHLFAKGAFVYSILFIVLPKLHK